jgi:hypothetical protein
MCALTSYTVLLSSIVTLPVLLPVSLPVLLPVLPGGDGGIRELRPLPLERQAKLLAAAGDFQGGLSWLLSGGLY